MLEDHTEQIQKDPNADASCSSQYACNILVFRLSCSESALLLQLIGLPRFILQAFCKQHRLYLIYQSIFSQQSLRTKIVLIGVS